MSEQERRTTKHRRADYRQTLATIRANVGNPQPVLVEATALWTTLVSNGRLKHEFAQSAIRAAVENSDVVKWTDGDGAVRYALTTDGLEAAGENIPYGPKDVPAFRECIKTEANRDNPDETFIAWANQRLGEL